MGADRDCVQNFDMFSIYVSGHITSLHICILEDTRSTAEVLLRV